MAEAQKDSERVASFKGGSEEEQVVVTINARMGRIVKVEKIDKAGAHEELEQEEWTKLVGENEVEEVEDALEEAFEMGVAAALGEEYEGDDSDESDEERSMRRLLIRGLLRSPVQRRILQRLIVSRLLRRRVLQRRMRQ
jgi:hypothetical protein